MNSISKNTIITFLAQLLSLGLGIIILIILVRVLGPMGKGIYALIILIPTVAIKLAGLGIEEANIYFTGSKKYLIKDIISSSFIFAFSLGLILILLFWILSQFNFFQNFLDSNQINLSYLWIAVLTIPFTFLFTFLNSIFLGREEIVKFNLVKISFLVIQLIAVILFLMILKQSVFGAILSYTLATIIIALFVILLIRKIVNFHPSFNRALFKNALSYGGKIYLGNIAQFLNYRLDMLLIAIFLIPASVGLYSIAVEIVEKLWLIPMAAATVLFPRVSSLKDSQVNFLTPRVCRHTLFIITVISLGLVILAYPLIKIFFGSAFLPSLTPLLILLPGIVAFSGARVLLADLSGRGKPEIGMRAAFISLAINIPLNILLIPRWGISGAAFASTIAYILATLIIIIAFAKISKRSFSEILLVKKRDFEDYQKIFSLVKKSGKL